MTALAFGALQTRAADFHRPALIAAVPAILVKTPLAYKETNQMSFTIPSLGQILASHASSGVSVSAPATQTRARLTKGVHASASQPANQTQFSAVFNAVRKAN